MEDVQEWLGYIHIQDGRLVDRYGKEFMDNSIDGKVLVRLNDESLRGIGVTSFGMRKRILGEIRELKRKRRTYISYPQMGDLILS